MSGLSGQTTNSIARDLNPNLSATDQQDLSSLLSGRDWNGMNITFSFPTSSSQYGTQATYGDASPFNGFATLSAAQQNEALRAFSLISGYTSETFSQISETNNTHATIRLIDSATPKTSYAYYPSSGITGGDVFYGHTGLNPSIGNFDFAPKLAAYD